MDFINNLLFLNTVFNKCLLFIRSAHTDWDRRIYHIYGDRLLLLRRFGPFIAVYTVSDIYGQTFLESQV